MMPMSDSKALKRKQLRNAEYYNMIEIFDDLYAKSLNGYCFNNLYPLITSDENIKLAYRNIKKNSGSNTAGVDKLTIKDLEKIEEIKFVEYVRNKLADYKPKPVKRVEIPKPNGKMRPLGIPAIWDRIVQQCILQVLEPICEAKFHDRSNGFRPNRSTEHAIAQCYKMMQQQNLHYVVDVDIKGFFDNVVHGKLLKQMWSLGIRDKNLLSIISKMLKAPIVMPNGKSVLPTKGTPQGGILSPLLSNIVLNELDWWVTSQWEDIPTKKPINVFRSNGTIDKGNKYQVLRKTGLKEVYLVRYADDFKIFCRNFEDANKIFHATVQWLKDRLGLEISDEKSKIINLKKNYSEFLGFKMKVAPKSNKYVVRSHICDKAKANISDKLRKIIKEIKHPKNDLDEYRKINLYNSTVIGIHNYYRLATCVNEDLSEIAYQMKGLMKNHKLGKRISKSGVATGYIKEQYGDSKELRFIRNSPLVPLSYIKHKNPMFKKSSVNKYTPKGRLEIHSKLKAIDMKILRWLMNNPVEGRSIEYNDNRISLYSAQKGKCAILGHFLEVDRIHCHHKKPLSHGGTDEYKNLVIVDSDIHILIHAILPETIAKYLNYLEFNHKQLTKLNQLRKLVGNEPI